MDFAVPILEKLHNKYGVSLVVTQPDKPVGRKQVLQGTPVKNKALALGIEVFQPVSIKKDNARIIEQDFDFIIVAAYGQIIPDKILYHGKYQAINVHASLLPKYRGGSPMHQAIIDGEAETGVTIMFMEKALDSGFILSQSKCEITENDNVKTLESKLSIIGSELLIKTLDQLLKNEIQAVPQEESLVSYAYNFKKEQLEISFDKSARSINNFVRGLNPWPIAFMMVDGKTLKVFDTEYYQEKLSDNISEIVKIDKRGIHIQALSGVVVLRSIQLEGKKRMDASDFMNGIGRNLFFVGQILKDSL